MRRDLRIVVHDVGSVLAAVGVLTVSAVAVAFFFAEWDAAAVMAATAGLFVGVGLVARRLCRGSGRPRLKHAMLTSALAWLVIAVLSVPPYLLIEGLAPLEALFEGMSGWTATGLTMIPDIESSTRTVQYYRSFSEWIGGVGVIVLTLIVLVRPGTASYALYRSEARQERIRPSIVNTVRTIWKIYLLYTFLSVALVWALLPEATPDRFWHALNLAMTGIATGGFSITNASVGAYGSAALEAGLVVVMVLGAIPFVAHYNLLRGRPERFLRDLQVAALFGVVLAVGALVTLTHPAVLDAVGTASAAGTGGLEGLLAAAGQSPVALRQGFFQAISAATTTGFQTVDLAAWGATPKLLLTATMVVGAGAGSTVGGVKLVRALLLGKAVAWKIRRSYLPTGAHMQHRFGGHVLDKAEADDAVSDSAMIAFIWVVALFLGVLVLAALLPGIPVEDVAFEVASAQSNVGLSTGITGPDLPDLGKAALVVGMWAGRLEIIPVLMLLQALVGTSPYDRFVRSEPEG